MPDPLGSSLKSRSLKSRPGCQEWGIATEREKTVPWWLWPNVLSLDAPLVALVWHAAGAQAFAVPFSGLTAWLLVSSVWMIYALDRLLDGRGGPGKTPETQRHAFHRRHQRGFAACLGGGLILNAVLLLWVDAPLLRFGVGLLVASGGYGLMVHCLRRSWLPKELVCGGVFSVGVMGSLPIESFPWGGVSLFAVLCTANCLVIACGEVGIDRRSDALAGPQRWPWLRETMGWLVSPPVCLSAACGWRWRFRVLGWWPWEGHLDRPPGSG
jgi:hypothetical protein